MGQNLGAGNIDRARASGYETLRWQSFSALVGTLFFLAPGYVIGPSPDQQVIPLASKTLRVLGLAQPALATALILAGGLRGAGDTRYVMYVTALGMLGVRLALTLLFLSLGWGLARPVGRRRFGGLSPGRINHAPLCCRPLDRGFCQDPAFPISSQITVV